MLNIGIDEVARGCFFGRVYAAAVILPNFEEIYNDKIILENYNLIRDSKKLNKKQREKLKHEQRQVFDHIMVTFFSEESEDQIALSNQKLFDILSTYWTHLDTWIPGKIGKDPRSEVQEL